MNGKGRHEVNPKARAEKDPKCAKIVTLCTVMKIVQHATRNATNATGEAIIEASVQTKTDHDRSHGGDMMTTQKQSQYESGARESRTTPHPLR